MAKRTLLDMTQSILSDMDSDYASSIGESVESMQVANIIKESYFYIINNVLDLPEHEEILTLTALADLNHPTYFQIPDRVKTIVKVRYNNATAEEPDLRYEDVDYLSPMEFQKKVNLRTESDDDVIVVNDFNAGKLLINNNKKPEFWTTFDDNYVVMDSYVADLENTLQQSKLFCMGLTEPTWTHEDDFIPDLDAHLFPLLINEAKRQCFVDLKQVENTIAATRARQQITRIHNKLHKHPVDRLAEQPNYGRK